MKLKIGYFADGPWSHKAIEKILNDKELEVSFICVRFESTDETLLNYAKINNVEYFKHKNINSQEFIEKIKTFNCDLFVSMSFNQIFKNEIINIPKYKSINCHAGKLPFYRGRNVLNWVLINDEKEFGITVHFIDEGIDTGDIILQRTFKITDEDDYNSLLNKAYIGCAEILYDTIIMFKDGMPNAKNQNEIHPVGFYCSQRKEGDEYIDWNKSSREVFNFVRSICDPGPMARSIINKKVMKINKVELVNNAPNYLCVNGAILKKEKDGSLLVKTNDNMVKIIDYYYDDKIRVGDRFQ